jgi:hypothetical protein
MPGGIKTVLDEIGSEVKGKTLRFEDFVDLRALRELEKEGALSNNHSGNLRRHQH